jgi:hypothetical protein
MTRKKAKAAPAEELITAARTCIELGLVRPHLRYYELVGIAIPQRIDGHLFYTREQVESLRKRIAANKARREEYAQLRAVSQQIHTERRNKKAQQA